MHVNRPCKQQSGTDMAHEAVRANDVYR
jgi:hypothetical protein